MLCVQRQGRILRRRVSCDCVWGAQGRGHAFTLLSCRIFQVRTWMGCECGFIQLGTARSVLNGVRAPCQGFRGKREEVGRGRMPGLLPCHSLAALLPGW